MRKLQAILALALAAALAASAAAADEAKQQFIDKTYVQLPKSVGIYSLEKTQYDPHELGAGVSSLYNLRGAPKELTVSLFVYPQGRADEDKVVDQQIDGVEKVIRLRTEYTNIEAGPRTSFVVDAPKPSAPPKGKDDDQRKQAILFTKPADDASAATDAQDRDPLADVLKDAAPPTKTTGRRQRFELEYNGVKTHSAGFVFYRNLFNIKLRISIPADRMSKEEFDETVDNVARTLVPLVDIQNFGDCGNIVIALPKETGNKDKDSENVARVLMQQMGRVQRENCASEPGDKLAQVPEGYERTEIVYPPSTWQSN